MRSCQSLSLSLSLSVSLDDPLQLPRRSVHVADFTSIYVVLLLMQPVGGRFGNYSH